MSAEAKNLLDSLGDKPISLQEAELFKQRFGPAMAKKMKQAHEPVAPGTTDAMAETYSALQHQNEDAAAAVEASKGLGTKFVPAKQAYARLAAPLEGANVERSGLQPSDFQWGDALNQPDTPLLSKLEAAGIPKWLGGAVVTPLNVAGRAYGRGALANVAEAVGKHKGGSLGAQVGSSAVRSPLAPWSRFLKPDEGDE